VNVLRVTGEIWILANMERHVQLSSLRIWLVLGIVTGVFGACDAKNVGEPTYVNQATGGGVSEWSCSTDDDGDGFCGDYGFDSNSPKYDCADHDPTRNRGATEMLNALDDDCDGVVDNGLTSECPLTLTAPPDGCEVPTDLVAGALFACTLTNAGRVYCWGDNAHGALGTPDLTNVSVPVAVPGLSGAKSVVASAAAVCAGRESDAVCWGADSAFPFTVPLPAKTSQLAIGYSVLSSGWNSYMLYALDSTGQAWARDFVSKSGVAPSFAKVQTGVKRLVGGGTAMCALTTADSLICNLGTQPTTITTNKVDYATKGVDGSLCYTTGGELYCIKGTDKGSKVDGNGSAVNVGVSSRYGCAINAAGKLSCWTGGSITSVEDAMDLAVGNTFGCILRQSGRLSCWGNNSCGELGNGRVDPNENESAPVDVRPGPALELPSFILLGSTPLGACDTAQDLAVFGKDQVLLHAAFAACKAQCQDRLDTAECLTSCAKNPGLTKGCFDCYSQLAACSGADCYAAFNACAGYPVDFARALSNEPRFECDGALCLRGSGVGQACSNDTDCLTGNCGRLPQAPDILVCAGADGAYCSTNSPYCGCAEGTSSGGYSASGHCGSCYGEGRVASATGTCYRACGYCGFGTCKKFSNSYDGYCD
jgi:hypothetical protein